MLPDISLKYTFCFKFTCFYPAGNQLPEIKDGTVINKADYRGRTNMPLPLISKLKAIGAQQFAYSCDINKKL